MAVRLWRNNTYLDEYLNTEVRTCAKTNNCISMYLYFRVPAAFLTLQSTPRKVF